MRLRRMVAALVTTGTLAIGSMAAATPAHADGPIHAPGGPVLAAWHYIEGGRYYWQEAVVSWSGRFAFVVQSDCNFVHQDWGQPSGWATDTHEDWDGWFCRLIMQPDGNLVLYANAADRECCWYAAWSSQTHGNPGAVFWVQDDGNAVIYAPGPSPGTLGRVLWSMWHGRTY